LPLRRVLSVAVIVLGLAGACVALRESEVWVRHSAPVTTTMSPASGARAADIVPDDRRRQTIGVRTARVSRGSLEGVLRGTGIVRYADPRLVDVNLRVDGWITHLYVDAEGQQIRRGQPLFSIFSQELLTAQNELLLALKNRDLIAASNGANARETSQRVLDVPRLTLSRLDVSADQIQALEQTRQIPASVMFRSPTDGVVIEKSVVPGMYVEHGRTLLRVADLTEVWIEADFPQADFPSLTAGASATVTFNAWPGQQFHGSVDRIYPQLAETSGKLRAIIALANHERRLKLGMFANVDVAGTPLDGLVVPTDAIVDSGKRTIVFIAKGDGYYEPRDVVVGRTVGGKTVIVQGLRENEDVVTRAAFFIDSESNARASLESYTEPTASSTTPAQPSELAIGLVTIPDPPRVGINQVEVRVLDAQKRPLPDAAVDVLLSMAPMPSMNMPAMQTKARLIALGNGVYKGAATIDMAGRWDVSITVLRSGHSLASRKTTLLVR
jgi:membrane fusion protein, copper/silver efflux system